MATQGQKIQGQKKQGQGQAIEFIGKGHISTAMLSSPKTFARKLVQLGVEEPVANFIVAVSAPKGHPNKMTAAAAIKEYLPGLAQMSAISRAFNALTEINNYSGFLCALLYGAEATELKERAEMMVAEKKVNKGTYTHRPIEERAAAIAHKTLVGRFRAKHKMQARGRVKSELLTEYNAYIAENIEAETAKIVAKMTKGQGKKTKKEKLETVAA
jgi:hypothetical protein